MERNYIQLDYMSTAATTFAFRLDVANTSRKLNSKSKLERCNLVLVSADPKISLMHGFNFT